MSFVIAKPPRPSVAVAGTTDRFPVRRIYCIGRNYLAHRQEMGNDDRTPPFFFQKPADALLPVASPPTSPDLMTPMDPANPAPPIAPTQSAGFPYPSCSNDVQFEVELVVALGGQGKDIAVSDALDHVYGYGVGLDMTRRDLQSQAKDSGKPWDAAKGFDHAAPLSALRPARDIGHPASGRIWLSVNGTIRQDSDLNLQIWTVQESIAHLSRLFQIMPGDLIYTGTPHGVGAILPGDTMTGGIQNIGQIEVTVV